MKTTSVSLMLAGLMIPAAVEAQAPEPPPRNPERPGEAQRTHQRRFADAWKKADKDNDGFISREEFNAMPRIGKLPEEKRPQLFGRLDKNADGRLGHDELVRIGPPQNGPRQPLQRLWELDTDRSGGVSLEEFKAGRVFQKLQAGRQDEIFRKLDTDGDGMLTPKDKPQQRFRHEPGGQSRPPGEGGLGNPDARWPDPRRMIRQLDRDGDGALSFEEFRAGPAVSRLDEDAQEDRFEAMDRNHDGKLTAEETGPPPAAAEPQSPGRQRPGASGPK